ncbi:MAG: hypothetical protein Unbinned5350contig1001_54 [Prokaryotic dsDNA virus sp.]|nr:MAG: hypothetical protein Unbinned5350contig1001_54 [Prokaryotic dsDNA virus sp.]|tara:strand:- start:1402 stop:2556 length:1155 start_codon:yes stop_codon:yes gene_type:complete
MYNSTKIKAGLIGLMGWKQNEDLTGWQLTEMITSESGSFYNSVHPLLTMDNLISISKRYNDLATTQSEINTFFTNWLKGKTEEAILDAVDVWLESKFVNRSVKNLLEDDLMFDGTGDLSDYNTNNSQFVGMEFKVTRGLGIMMKLRSIGLQFETNQTITFLLYKSGIKTAVKTVDVAYNQNGGIQWVDLSEWELDGDGTYWVGYDEANITGRSINGIKDYGFEGNGLEQFPSGRFYGARAMNVDGYTNQLWDLSTTKYSLSTNYGLNFKLDVRCDYTDFILNQKNIFRRFIWLNVGIRLLEEMMWNANSNINRNESNIDETKVLYAIEGDTQKTGTGRDISLTGKREMALLAIAFDESGLSRVCLPCKKKGIKVGAIGPGGFRG